MRPHPIIALFAALFLLANIGWHFGGVRPWVYSMWQWTTFRIGLSANDLDQTKYVQNILVYQGVYENDAPSPMFLNRTIPVHKPVSYVLPKDVPQVLSVQSIDNKWIEVDLSEQKVSAHEGDQVVLSFPVSTGKWAPTPTGEYRIWIKLRYHRMIGGLKELGTFYDLPNVPFVMYFYKGYGLHGAYWHNNFGQPMSHGCVNVSIPDAEKLYNWAGPAMPEGASVVKPTPENPGTKVVVHD